MCPRTGSNHRTYSHVVPQSRPARSGWPFARTAWLLGGNRGRRFLHGGLLSFLQGRSILAVLGTQIQLDWHVVEGQPIAKSLEEITAIGVIEEVRSIGEQDDGRRMDADLGGVEDLRPTILPQRRRLLREGPAQNSVQVARADPDAGLLVQMLGQVQHRMDVLAALGRDESDGHKVQAWEGGPKVATELPCGHRPHQVPLVGHENGRLVILQNVLRQLLVHLADRLAGVEKKQDDVGPADGCSARAML